MALRVAVHEVRSLPGFLWKSIAFAALGVGLCAPNLIAKPPSLTAIVLYDGASGVAYLQVTDVMINGKAELRICTSFEAAPIDKSTYNKLQKLALAPGGTLERSADGVLRYRTGQDSAVCVAPDNVKFDHNATYSLSDLADQARLTGTPLAPPSDAAAGLPPLKKGVKLVFVAAPNQELAEFLRAQKAAEVSGWLDYLSRYPSSPHTSDAKLALALLYDAGGELSVTSYRKSAAASSPSYADLKDAKVQADKARAVLPDLAQTATLEGEIRAKLAAITDQGRRELDSYLAAFKAHAPGYIHLQNARRFSAAVSGIDPSFPAGQALLADLMQTSNALENVLRSAESFAAEKQMDKAIETLAPIRPFAAEEPRVAEVINAAYSYYLQSGKQFAAAGDWENAIQRFEKAASAKDTPEARESLQEARRQLVIVQDKAAAAKALETSKQYEQQQDILDAFEVLYSLPPSQQALVADDIARLKDGYIQSAAKAAQGEQKAHDPVRGLGDEIGIERAYSYLQRAYELTKNDSYRDTMNILGDDLSAYFVDQARRYLDKPSGSGTELGWTYLEEALFYKPSNQAAHDAKVQAAPAHAMHSKLSIRVQFRDQTSTRESTGFGFIRQLEDAIITGLEAPTLKAVRFGESTGGVEPDFQLAGDVLEHQVTETPTLESRESKYRAGTHDEPNEAWTKANRAFDAAQRALQTDQSALGGAEAKGNKKAIKDLNAKIAADQKLISEDQTLLDSLPKTVTSDVIRPYQYTRKTTDIKNTIKLQFRIGDTLSGQMGDAVLVEKEDPKQYVLVEDVKADDTEGVKPTGTTPSVRELQTELENAARGALIEAVLIKVRELPRMILDGAKSKEQAENVDGAGEAYLRFLSCSTEDSYPAERRHAREFLAEKFNMRPAANGVSP